MPSVAELAAEYAVSRATIVKVIKDLAGEGLLVTRERWGTFVPSRPAGVPWTVPGGRSAPPWLILHGSAEAV